MSDVSGKKRYTNSVIITGDVAASNPSISRHWYNGSRGFEICVFCALDKQAFSIVKLLNWPISRCCLSLDAPISNCIAGHVAQADNSEQER